MLPRACSPPHGTFWLQGTQKVTREWLPQAQVASEVMCPACGYCLLGMRVLWDEKMDLCSCPERGCWRWAEPADETPAEAEYKSSLTVSMTHSAWRRNRGKKPLPALTVRIPAAGSSCHSQPHTPTERRAQAGESNTCMGQRGVQEHVCAQGSYQGGWWRVLSLPLPSGGCLL